MTHDCSIFPRGFRTVRIVVVAGVLAGSLSVAIPVAASPIPRVNDRDCPSTAPIKTQVDDDIFCKTIPEFCAEIPFVEMCQPGATTTLAPGERRQPYSDDSIEVPGPVDGSRCPPSSPIATQVDDRLICFTVTGYCETRDPYWHDPSRNLACPAATTTSTSPPAIVTSVRGGTAVSESGPTEVRTQRGDSAYLISPATLSIDGGSAGSSPTTVTVRATKRGARMVSFTLRARGNRPIEIPSTLSRQGYRIIIFVDGARALVIPPSS
jgi:hypothetical protein